MEDYSWVEIDNSGWESTSVYYDVDCCSNSFVDPKFVLINTVKAATNRLLLVILVVWLVLIPFLIYRKHKWEKWLWKKIVKWDLIFFFIIVAIWFIISFALWYFPSRPIQPGSFN